MYKQYIDHLEHEHEIHIKVSNKSFASPEDFKCFQTSESRDVNYSLQSGTKTKSSKILYYNCNRSDTKGTLLINLSLIYTYTYP